MRGAFGGVVCGALAMLVGCSDELVPTPYRGGGPGTDSPESIAAAARAPVTVAETACAGAPKTVTLSDAVSPRDVRIVGAAVFFQSGSSVFRVMKDGTNKQEIFKSANLVRSYVDKTAMIAIESTTDAPEATLRIIQVPGAAAPPAGVINDAPFPVFGSGVLVVPAAGVEVKDGAAALGTTTATKFNAAGTRVFASDETSFYLLADTDNGDAIVKVSKNNPATQTVLATSANIMSSPQISGSAIWYVRDQQRIYKVALAGDGAADVKTDAAEVFGISYATCSLAVDATNAFCSVGSAVERRDLTGANPMTILDAQKSKAGVRFGLSMNYEGTIFVRSEAPDAKVKHVIRALKPNGDSAEEKFVACGRDLVTDLSVDATSVVWTEEKKGVFLAPR